MNIRSYPIASPLGGVFVAACILVLTGCANVNPLPDYERVRELVANATVSADLYIPGQSTNRGDSLKGPTGGMTRYDAIRIALMNNKDLQSLMFEIGVSHSDVVQAGLLSNPSLNGVLRFSTSGGTSTFEAGILQGLFEVFRLPARHRIAKTNLERKIMEVALGATNLAAETSTAYIDALIAYKAEAVAAENVMTARELLFVAKERLSAGVGTQLDINAAEAEAVEQDLQRQWADLNVKSADLALSELMGVEQERGFFTATLTNPIPPDVSHDLETLLELAEANRLDICAKRIQVEIARERLQLEKRTVIRELSVGASVETTGERNEVGPAINIELPLFDQNRAQIAKAEYRVSQAVAQLDSQRLAMRNEVRLALKQHEAARDSLDLYERRLLPLRRESLSMAREAFNEGKTQLLFVIEYQRQLLQTRIEYLSRLRTYLNSISNIERAVGLSIHNINRHANIGGCDPEKAT